MSPQELLSKHQYITDISNLTSKIEITIYLDIKGIKHMLLHDMTFNSIEECDEYLSANYLKLKYDLLEELVMEEQRKSMEQRVQLRLLNKAYAKVLRRK